MTNELVPVARQGVRVVDADERLPALVAAAGLTAPFVWEEFFPSARPLVRDPREIAQDRKEAIRSDPDPGE
jgi:hypothetical protein